MDTATEKREREQFNGLVRAASIAYPIWLLYGIWTDNYEGPVSVGLIAVWAIWNICRVKVDVEKAHAPRAVDWRHESVEKHVNKLVFSDFISRHITIIGLGSVGFADAIRVRKVLLKVLLMANISGSNSALQARQAAMRPAVLKLER